MKQYREMHVVESGRCSGEGSCMCLDARERYLSIFSSGYSNEG